jgi:hypothetical protein
MKNISPMRSRSCDFAPDSKWAKEGIDSTNEPLGYPPSWANLSGSLSSRRENKMNYSTASCGVSEPGMTAMAAGNDGRWIAN